ncbi:transmembrane protein 181 isoform X4 [Scyliorhinus torazame]|uniref:transmembrane protein 181 isoform X4 n=1 Tax=Scyliorhinus torazame TaxID=75743 RepID=UPI003B5C939A
MDSEYPSFENPLYTELKYFCKKVKGAYMDLKEDLIPDKDDRYYRIAPMRLYTLSKRHFVLVFVVFFICFGLIVFIGIAGPEIITSRALPPISTKSKDSLTSPLKLQTPGLSTYNQELWLMCRFELNKSAGVEFTKMISMMVGISGVMQDTSVPNIRVDAHSHTRSLHCTNLKMYNASFSQVEIWFRFIFVVFTFMVTCLFAHSLRKFSMKDWAIEQKWMSILLPLLLLYNDPFFPLSFLVNSWFPGMLDDLFQAVFLCALLLFWLCVYHGFRVQGERNFMTFYLPKLLIVGLLWLAAVTLGIWQTVNELRDPTYQYRVDTSNFQGMKIFFLIVGSLYILYLVFLIVRACSELKNMPYFDLRLKFLTGLTFIVLIISIVILYLRFGAKVLQDNFVAELSTHYQNSAEFLSFYGLLNYYLYTLAYVYSPSKNAVYESQLKDNPAFSMLNDSDDDVIYGSDYEEMPLQNGRAIKSKYKDESDSD